MRRIMCFFNRHAWRIDKVEMSFGERSGTTYHKSCKYCHKRMVVQTTAIAVNTPDKAY